MVSTTRVKLDPGRASFMGLDEIEEPPPIAPGDEIPCEVTRGVVYRVVRAVGEGAMSVAYYALRVAPEGETPVVIKVLRPWFVRRSGPTAALIAKKEAVALGRLNERVPATPFVVRLLDAGTFRTRAREQALVLPWLVLEYVHGGAEGTKGSGQQGGVEGPKASVSGGGQVSVGKVSNAERVLAGARGRIRACYQNGLNSNPDMEGRVSFVVSIGGSGSVSNANVTPTGTINGSVVSCIQGVLKGLNFDAPEGGAATVNGSYNFVNSNKGKLRRAGPAMNAGRGGGIEARCFLPSERDPVGSGL